MKLIADCLWATTREGRKARSHLMWEVVSRDEAQRLAQKIVDTILKNPTSQFMSLSGNSQILGSVIRLEDLRMMTFRVLEADDEQS